MESDVADQVQPAAIVTVTEPVELAAASDEGAAESVAAQADEAFCAMANVCPPIVKEPEREAASVLAAAV